MRHRHENNIGLVDVLVVVIAVVALEELRCASLLNYTTPGHLLDR